ncbi:sterol desaturase family protein [uncultured Roseibium sp.]|uniref:sterol desaturase family protein n=1 Tax=uncultured Roseibium sp. TaxID=1936171 RepID=UPI002607DEB5|nr:sterol desaturase family protein [uncultured Roseibium sp.]
MDVLADFAQRLQELFLFLVNNRLESLTFAATIAFLLVVVLVDLHRRGYRFSWPRRLLKSVGANIAFWWVSLLFAPAVLLLTYPVKQFYDAIGLPGIDESFWQGVPAWLLVPLAIVCYDFANYWNHRLMHHRWFWPIHAIHHSDPDMNALTAYRIHFLESVVMGLSYILLLSWLGFPTGSMGMGAVLLTLHSMYVHLNVDWDHGPFKYVIASPRMHQWHHADFPEAYGKNLANIFPIFDLAFGTYFVPGPCHEPLGAKGVPENDVVKLILYPFAVWGKMVLNLVRPSRKVRASAPDDPAKPETHRTVEPDASTAAS